MRKHLKLLVFVIFGFGCKEPYFAEISNTETMLVVDGLLSDETNVIKVTLQNATPFGEKNIIPEMGANVAVIDDIGNYFYLYENTPGYYTSYNFEYQYGRTYTLLIRTKNNKNYKSTPQILYPKSYLQPILSNITTKIFQSMVNGKIVFKKLTGLEFSTFLNSKTTESPYFRFSNTLLIEYLERVLYWNPYSGSENYFCWKKYKPNLFFNLNDTKFNNLEQHEHTLAFCPVDSTYYSILDEDIWFGSPPRISYSYSRDVYYFVITIKKYHLNEDVYQYYKSINAQLESTNHVFDPISFQVQGNITCEDDPDEPVSGVFEVSSADIKTYSFSMFLPDKSVRFSEVNPIDVEGLTENGKQEEFPWFWILNY